MHAEFWVAVGQIILIDILLGGDNAVVIALACRKLPPNLRTKGILWGTAGAIGLRVVAAIKTIIVADLVMSVDNVIAIAGAAESVGGDHKMPLVIFGLLVSIPIIVWGSQLVIKLMDRFPVIITLGGMLLGWIAGTMAVTDPAVLGQVPTLSPGQPGTVPEVLASVRYGAGLAGALLVLAIGLLLKRRAAAAAT